MYKNYNININTKTLDKYSYNDILYILKGDKQMIDLNENPSFLNEFLEYLTGILNKSPNTVKEYNYDLSHFLKFIMHHFNLDKNDNIKEIDIHDMDISIVKRITLNDIHSFYITLLKIFTAKRLQELEKQQV